MLLLDSKRSKPPPLTVPDLSIEFCGVRCAEPFLASFGPWPTNSEYQVAPGVRCRLGRRRLEDARARADRQRFFTLWRYSIYDGRKLVGMNNIELITDRTLEVNLQEIARVKKAYPNHALFVSLMVESTRNAWHDIGQANAGYRGGRH